MDFIGPLRESNGFKHILNMIDRFSHFIVLVPVATTSARVVVDSLFQHWICSFGVPRFLTTDGGSSFVSESMAQVSQLLEIDHHISAPYHPEGHGIVERANHTVMQTIRALFRGNKEWSLFVRPAASAINTSTSRALGVSPFDVVHGFAPRLPINNALDVRSELLDNGTDNDPLAFAQHLITSTAALFARVREIQAQLYERELAAVRKKCRKQVDFEPGNHVLVRFPRTEKILLEWRGPYQIIARENPVIYIVADLVNGDTFRTHVNRIHLFYPGDLTADQLIAESAKQDEYYIEAVYNHKRIKGELWFYVKWLGYPDLPESDIEAWVRLSDCRCAPAIRKYRQLHRL